MNLFLDTEFTDLVPGNKLISIALVDENEEYFYAELTDTYTFEQCSSFTKLFVIPYLRGGAYSMTWAECALKIGNWIEDRNEPCILVCDNPGWDLPHLMRMLEDFPPPNLSSIHKTVIFYGDETIKKALADNLDAHNALDDAIVMKRIIGSR